MLLQYQKYMKCYVYISFSYYSWDSILSKKLCYSCRIRTYNLSLISPVSYSLSQLFYKYTKLYKFYVVFIVTTLATMLQ